MIDEKIKEIVDYKHVFAVMLWPQGDRFLGALLDERMEQIQSSVPWNPLASADEVIDSLSRAAQTLRERGGQQ